MKKSITPLFPLSNHVFRTHFSGAENFSNERTRGYTPSQLRRVYAFDENFTGEGIKIAVICALDNEAVSENMQVFCNEFSLPVPKMSVFYPFGRAENTSSGWLTESSLDTQWVHVFAPSAEIFVVFSRDADTENMLSASKFATDELGADIVSMSFGTEESASDKELSAFMENSLGIFVASSGDLGGKVSFPSTSPNCISVGGTSLTVSPSGKRIEETTWQNGGGGKSDIFEIPAYQGRFFNIYGISDGMRGTPDVSMSANYNSGVPIYVSQLGGWTTIGGTSLSTACFSGICACIKERHPEITTSVDILSFLYSKAGGSGYSFPQYNFYDITVGKSGNYYAEKGWDFATGLGSPVIRQLIL